MAYEHTFRHFPEMQFPRIAMRRCIAACINPKGSIAVLQQASSPQPALAALIDFYPESSFCFYRDWSHVSSSIHSTPDP